MVADRLGCCFKRKMSRAALQLQYNRSKQLYLAATQGLINISQPEKDALLHFIREYEALYLAGVEGDG